MIKLLFYFLPFLCLFLPNIWVNYVLKKNNEILPNMPFTGNQLGQKLLQENNLENVETNKTKAKPIVVKEITKVFLK